MADRAGRNIVIVVTGGAGFIGSALIWHLNQLNISEILVVDRMGSDDRWKNLVKLRFQDYIDKDKFLVSMDRGDFDLDFIFHVGACSATTERNVDYLMDNNFIYSTKIFQHALSQGIPLVYASSAATYGDGALGFSDTKTEIMHRPINPYGFSKEIFDRWVLRQPSLPPFWAGLKFFNVYGPNEYHKGDQASLVFKAFHQIREDGRLKLFKSHRPDYGHGLQLRDFVYVKDVVKVMGHILTHHQSKKNPIRSGIYNLGTGKAESFLKLAQSTFIAMGKEPAIDFIDMPEALRGQYQYFTQAEMEKIKDGIRFDQGFCSVESGVDDYVKNYLLTPDAYL